MAGSYQRDMNEAIVASDNSESVLDVSHNSARSISVIVLFLLKFSGWAALRLAKTTGPMSAWVINYSISSERKEIVSPFGEKNVVQPVELQAMLLNAGHTHSEELLNIWRNKCLLWHVGTTWARLQVSCDFELHRSSFFSVCRVWRAGLWEATYWMPELLEHEVFLNGPLIQDDVNGHAAGSQTV